MLITPIASGIVLGKVTYLSVHTPSYHTYLTPIASGIASSASKA